MSDRCRSCDAEVVFVPSAKTGKPMILDAQPTKGVILTTKFLPNEDLPRSVAGVVDVYTDHHATCPRAADWKGRRR